MNGKVKILIVEDEFMIAEDIAMRLSDFGYIISGKASSADEALDILENEEVDIAILDINIDGDVDGIDLALKIKENYHIPIIFLSSLANKSIIERAKNVNPSAFLLKPFNDRQVQISLDLAMENYTAKSNQIEDQNTPTDVPLKKQVYSYNNNLFLRKEHHFQKVSLNEILYLEADGSYTTIYTKDNSFFYTDVLRSFEEKLPTNMFKRVHRSYIVNMDSITGFEGNMIYIGKIHIPVSRSMRDDIFKDFKIM